MSYRILLHKRATKTLQNMPESTRQAIKSRIDLLAEDPYQHPQLDIKKMQGFAAIYRLRVGQYRIIYEIIADELVVLILRLGSRGDVYKG
jgi:mRNA interferase RelE/StbE